MLSENVLVKNALCRGCTTYFLPALLINDIIIKEVAPPRDKGRVKNRILSLSRYLFWRRITSRLL